MSNYGQQPGSYGQGQPGPGPYGQPRGNPNTASQQPPGQQQWGPPNPQQPRQPPYPQQPHQQPYLPQPPQPPYPPQPPPAQPGVGQPGGWTPQPASVARPAIPSRAISVVTMEAVPGRDIAAVIGDVVGVVVRPRELAPELRAGNPLDGYATMLTRSRQDAVTKMIDMAVGAGADAVVGFRYDCSEITQSLSEVSAYGTAVKLAPEPEVAAARSEADAGLSEEQTLSDEPATGTPRTSGTSGTSPASDARTSGETREPTSDTGPTDGPWPPTRWSSQD